MLPGLALDSPRPARFPVDRVCVPRKRFWVVVQRAPKCGWNNDICAGARLFCSTCEVFGGSMLVGADERGVTALDVMRWALPGFSARGGAMVSCSSKGY